MLTAAAESIRIALGAIWANKLRAVLTTLGIIIGIVSVTAMFTTINGIEREFNRSMAMIGTDALFVQRHPWFFTFDDWWRYRNRPPIEEEHAAFIREHSQYAAAVAPLTGAGTTAQRGSETMEGVSVEASTPEYVDTGGMDFDAGRFFTDAESRAARRVVVLGADIVDQLFPAEDPIGKEIRLSGEPYEVIGVLARRGKFLGLASTDNVAVIPLSAFERTFGPPGDLALKVRVAGPEAMDAAQEEITGIMRLARGLDPMEDDDFSINRQEQFRQLFETMRVTIYGVGIFLTALSLLVGGIGVMNIMFVSVRERRREIGIRKAVGARRAMILLQFLIEAVLICLVGGLIGVGLAALVTWAINQVFTAYLSPFTVALAFFICVVVGIVFGLVPAWQAARARPIEALRYE
ncbi:MAG TPA: ABC transporter permease [Rubricoccaceae bacterium]|nr:ABC transporter permease [Rubricoccaceae bacterium]